jgi:hypothetical protein
MSVLALPPYPSLPFPSLPFYNKNGSQLHTNLGNHPSQIQTTLSLHSPLPTTTLMPPKILAATGIECTREAIPRRQQRRRRQRHERGKRDEEETKERLAALSFMPDE